MMQISKILVTTDFSPGATKALRYAEGLARVFGAELVLAHVLEPPVYPAVSLAGGVSLPSIYDELRGACGENLERTCAEVATDVRCRTVLRDGRAFTEICEAARDEAVDLIVIGTHGYSGFKHLMLGSTAERVVRHAPCPVLTVGREDSEEAAGGAK